MAEPRSPRSTRTPAAKRRRGRPGPGPPAWRCGDRRGCGHRPEAAFPGWVLAAVKTPGCFLAVPYPVQPWIQVLSHRRSPFSPPGLRERPPQRTRYRPKQNSDLPSRRSAIDRLSVAERLDADPPVPVYLMVGLLQLALNDRRRSIRPEPDERRLRLA